MSVASSRLRFYSARKLCFAIIAAFLLNLFLSSCAQTPQTITSDTPPKFERLALITSDMLPGIERADCCSSKCKGKREEKICR